MTVSRAKLYTIGFTQSTAKHFFERLVDADVRVLLDTRLNRGGQLSGFAKDVDLRFFLSKLTKATYRTAVDLSPTKELLSAYREGSLSWASYAEAYRGLLLRRNVDQSYRVLDLDRACLLCSEQSAVNCHRGVAAMFFQQRLSDSLEIEHL